MYLELDGNGPLHVQLTRALKDVVLEGRLARGARLPPTRQLARELGVSRNTVLAAYEQLRVEGFIEGRVGSGSYVARPLRTLDGGTAAAAPVPPQSEFARRARLFHDHARIPGRTVPGVRYAFQYGVPMANPALTTVWARELAHAAVYTPPGYPLAQGLPALREAVCDYLARRRGVVACPDDVFIVAGTQQALALAARVLLEPGDVVALEEPHYNALREVMQIHGARLHTVTVDREGLCCHALPCPPPKLVCVTPSHQFPTGAVMSLPRRMTLLDYARRHGCWVLEDDYDGEFRYDGRPLAALRSLDRHGRVLYVGTFSKVVFPALRLGYLVVPPGLRTDFLNAKWQDDFGSPTIEQAALARFIANGGFERHLRRAARALRDRRQVLLEGMRAGAGDRLEIEDSHAGMHLLAWLRGRDRAAGEALVAHARARGLALYPVTPYYLDPPDRAGLLLGFASLTTAEIREAVALLVRCLEEAG